MTESRAVTVPNYDLKDRFELAKSFAASGFFGCKTPHEAMSLIMLAEAEGIPVGAAMMEYHIIDGKPSRKAVKIAERFIASGGRIDWEELTDSVARARFTHPKGSDVTIEWTIQQARNAGLIKLDDSGKPKPKQAWVTNPRAMLRSRVWSEGCVTCYPAYAVVTLSYEEALDLLDDKPAQQPQEVRGAQAAETPAEEPPEETPGVWRPTPTPLEGTGFLRGAGRRDAVSLMAEALERAAAHGIDALDAQWMVDIPGRSRLSSNAQYGLEEIYNRLRDPSPPAQGAGGADGPAPSGEDGQAAEPSSRQQFVDRLVKEMYQQTSVVDLKAWALRTLTRPTLASLSDEQRETLRSDYSSKLLALQEEERINGLKVAP